MDSENQIKELLEEIKKLKEEVEMKKDAWCPELVFQRNHEKVKKTNTSLRKEIKHLKEKLEVYTTDNTLTYDELKKVIEENWGKTIHDVIKQKAHFERVMYEGMEEIEKLEKENEELRSRC
jgi:hypothetical protein